MDGHRPRQVWFVGCLLFSVLAATPAMGQQKPARGCAELYRARGVVWWGASGKMTLEQFASYVAPVLWFSPDEPTLQQRSGRDIRVPAALPFEPPANGPVMYYEVTMVDELPGAKGTGVRLDQASKGQSTLDFDSVMSLRIKFIAYFPEESGLGQHLHDLEPTELRVVVGRANGALARDLGFECDALDYLIAVTRVTGEAHGNPWYYNVLNVDTETRLPIHVLVEEGKHAMATDKNGDGYYTPGYDVSVRINDAWGVRDTMRGGSLLSGTFEGWMAKVRRLEHRVLPPLPLDSPLRERLLASPGYAENAVYELRPYPSSLLAADQALRKKIEEKEVEGWPVVRPRASVRPIVDALEEGRELKPFSVAYRYDRAPGFTVAFPLLIVKNVQEPLAGGYLVNRLYTSDQNFRDWGWMVMYTPSGSRWFDQYLAAGMDVNRFETDDGSIEKTREVVVEAGFKFRFRAPNRVFGAVMNFWGVRVGIKNVGAMDIDHLSYVFEIGAGVW